MEKPTRSNMTTVTQIGIFAAGWSLLFLLISTALSSMPSAAIAFLGPASAAVFMALYKMRGGLQAAKSEFDAFGDKLKAEKDYGLFAVFAAGLGLALVFQVINRYTSAPSGADTLFFLATAPVFALLIALWNKEKPGWGKWIGIAAALAGAIMVLANWERPSSFSPFALFPKEEVLLMVSAFGLAVFAAAGKRLAERYDPEIMLTVAFWAVTPVGFLVLAPSGIVTSLTGLSRTSWILMVMVGVLGLAVPLLSLLKAVKRTTALTALTSVCLMPVLITSLIIAEKLSGFALLPTPFEVAPVLSGITVIIIGVSAVWLTNKAPSPQSSPRGGEEATLLSSRSLGLSSRTNVRDLNDDCHPKEQGGEGSDEIPRHLERQSRDYTRNDKEETSLRANESSPALEACAPGLWSRRGLGGGWTQKPSLLSSLIVVLALAAAAWSFIALFFTVENTSIQGTLNSGAAYKAVISTQGYNTISGVILLIAAAAAVMTGIDYYRGRSTGRKTAVWAIFSAALAASTFVSGKANIVSWLSTIPAEIQHAFGTEYVKVREIAVTNIPMLIAYGFIAAYVIVAFVVYAVERRE